MSSFDRAVNGYQILGLIHESGRSSVFRAVRKSDGERVVLKMLKSDHLTQAEWSHQKQEYETICRLKGAEGVIAAYGLVPYQQSLVMVLEDFGGESLKKLSDHRLRAGQGLMPLGEFLDLAIRITQGLVDIHTAHVIHKDINPSNIVYNPNTGELKIIDFRISTTLNQEYPALQNPGRVEGSLTYISPEQTGRMNRVVDYRTDLYSLGVTFYEMLTGHPPFESDDPLALVHAHMAKVPREVMTVNPGVPRIVSDMVMKLLAKNAEDRYQSAFGLKADLERCRSALSALPGPENLETLRFALAEDDYPGQFQLPQKLYGRDEEIQVLLASFDRAAKGGQELMLVAGYAGVGKSALVAEVHKPVTRKRGYFISGKFDQYKQNRPYAAFTQAFDQFADLLLTEPEGILRRWQERILAAVGGNGAVLTEVMPGLENIIGKQPAVPKFGGVENRNRFNLTFQAFVQAISTAEHPLVLFIDDWQWADLASLELLKVLLTGEKIAHFLMLGAYRDNEVDRIHPLMIALHDLTGAGVAAQTIKLGNLQPEHVRQLVQESLAGSVAESQALTELVFEKTQGNAFFTRQFLQNLYEEGWLRFDFDARRWTWDMGQIKAQNITDNVVDLMTGKLKRLPSDAANTLQLAACIGNEFDMQTLALIGRASAPTALVRLAQPITQGLVIPLDDCYKLPETAWEARFGFLHDRVQQAAYAQIPSPERQTVHLEIGRLLVVDTTETDLDQRVFSIVQHYNNAIPLITDEGERVQVAELNMKAAGLAYGAAAFGSAQAYLETALALMPPDAWTSRYDTMLRLHSQLATVLSLTGDFEQLERIFQIAEAEAHTMADTAQVKQAKIQSLLYRGNYAEAIELGLSFIQAMGVPINRNPSPEEAFKYLQETADWLTEARIQSLPHLPEAPIEVGLILEVASVINGPTYNSNMYLFFVFVSQITRLCIEQGLTPWAPVTLITFTILLSAALHDIPKARLLTNTTMQLFEERYRSDSPVSPLSLVIGGFTVHRYDHLKNTIPIFVEGVQKGLTSGTFQFAGYCAWWQVWHQLFSGGTLADAEAVSRQAEETCQKIQMGRLKEWCLLVHQAILNLQGKSDVPWILKGEAYDEEEKLAFAFQISDLADVFRIFFYKAWLHYLFEHPQESVKCFRETESYLLYGAGTYLVPLFYYYDTLANAALFDPQTTEEKTRILERIKHNLEQFEIWVRFARVNHQHKRDLMEAELARLEGRYWEATTFYQKAIQGARENEFLPEQALGYELCGQFWLGRGNEEIARFHLHKALSLYGFWGAEAKVKQLQTKYGFGSVGRPTQIQGMEELPGGTSIDRSWPGTETTQSLLDLASLLKVNQKLSQAVSLSNLLAEMIKILLENAGAERALVLYKNEEIWFIEASSEVRDHTVQTGLPVRLTHEARLSPSVFNYVMNCGRVVVLANAGEDPQFDDAYLRENRVKSVLCLPIWHEGKLRLILYLENNLTVGAFTEDRLELLRLLSGQMAISMEKVRTEEALRKSEAALRESEEKYRVLFESFPLGVSITDEDGNIIEVNRKSEVLLGIPEEKHVGRRYESREWKIITPDGAPMPVEAYAGVRAKRENRPVENVEMGIVNEDGKCTWLNVTAAPIPLRGFGEALAYMDITDRKRAEMELARHREHLEELVRERTKELEAAQEELIKRERLSVLGQLTATVSHELRNPLGVIRSSAFYVQKKMKGGDEKILKHLNRIESQVGLCDKIVGELLEYTRGSVSDMMEGKITSWLGKVLEEARGTEGIRITNAFSENLPKVLFDPGKMGRVMNNLLDNAIHAVRERLKSGEADSSLYEPEIRVGTAPAQGGVEIQVEDNGVGMDEETVRRAFEPLFTTKARGTGLGLAIVKKIVEEHGGAIRLESEPYKGTKAIVRIPAPRETS